VFLVYYINIAHEVMFFLQGKDQITDTVRCLAATGQSYALYLPVQYENKKSWPVILIFDPAARGRTGVNTFIEAARKYGVCPIPILQLSSFIYPRH